MEAEREKTHALFGPAGSWESYQSGHKSSLDIPEVLEAMGLGAFEYQCGRGVHIGEQSATALGERAREHGVALSVHAPYFINLSSDEPERVQKNVGYILASCGAAQAMGADRITVHCGGLSGQTRQAALEHTIAGLQTALNEMERQGYGSLTLCIETMGKVNVLGDLAEVLEICKSDARLLPCIDFGHLNARTGGTLDSEVAFGAALDEMKNALGMERARSFHMHFSRIEYGPKGELRHLTFASDTGFGPCFEHLAPALVARGMTPRCICESAGTQAEDALAMQRLYREALEKA